MTNNIHNYLRLQTKNIAVFTLISLVWCFPVNLRKWELIRMGLYCSQLTRLVKGLITNIFTWPAHIAERWKKKSVFKTVDNVIAVNVKTQCKVHPWAKFTVRSFAEFINYKSWSKFKHFTELFTFYEPFNAKLWFLRHFQIDFVTSRCLYGKYKFRWSFWFYSKKDQLRRGSGSSWSVMTGLSLMIV